VEPVRWIVDIEGRGKEQGIDYFVADYVNDDLPTGFDVVALV